MRAGFSDDHAEHAGLAVLDLHGDQLIDLDECRIFGAHFEPEAGLADIEQVDRLPTDAGLDKTARFAERPPACSGRGQHISGRIHRVCLGHAGRCQCRLALQRAPVDVIETEKNTDFRIDTDGKTLALLCARAFDNREFALQKFDHRHMFFHSEGEANSPSGKNDAAMKILDGTRQLSL